MNNKVGKKTIIFTFILMGVVIISGLFLIGYKLFSIGKPEDEIIEKKEVSKEQKVEYDLTDAVFPLENKNLEESVKSYKNDNYEITINKNKNIEIKTLNPKDTYIIKEIKNVIEFIVSEDAQEYYVLTEEGKIYIAYDKTINEILKEIEKNDSKKIFEQLIENEVRGNTNTSEEIVFKKIYKIKHFFGNETELGYNYIYAAKDSNEKIYSLGVTISTTTSSDNKTTTEKIPTYSLSESETIESFLETTTNNTVSTLVATDNLGFMLNKEGKLKIYQNGNLLENKFLLPDGTEAQVYKMFIEPINDYYKSYDLYIVTKNNKLYTASSIQYVNVSTKIELKEVKEGNKITKISYKTQDKSNLMTLLTFTFEDKDTFIIDNMYEYNTYNIAKGEK